MLKFAIKDIDKIAPVRVEEETGVQGSLGKLTMEKRENIPSTSLYYRDIQISISETRTYLNENSGNSNNFSQITKISF